jgi:transposase
VRGIRPQGAPARVRRQLGSEVLRDIRTLERKIADLNERIEAEVEAFGTSLIEIFGIGPILAAKIIGPVGGPKEARNKAKTLRKRRFQPRTRGLKRARRSFSTRWGFLGS